MGKRKTIIMKMKTMRKMMISMMMRMMMTTMMMKSIMKMNMKKKKNLRIPLETSKWQFISLKMNLLQHQPQPHPQQQPQPPQPDLQLILTTHIMTQGTNMPLLCKQSVDSKNDTDKGFKGYERLVRLGGQIQRNER